MPVTIYHNPNCSKSRQVLALLKTKDLELNIVEYLKNPPDFAELDNILKQLSIGPRELMRRKESPYWEESLDNRALTREELIAAMILHPILIERPIVLANGKAAIGRPPENVLAIL